MAALRPESLAGFFYHPRMLAVVHLVTLGWITTAILGATYIVAPLALRMELPSTRTDRIACALCLVGIAGIVAHFGLEEYSGIAWSGLMLVIAFALVAARVLRALARSPSPLEVRVHIGLAYGNLLLATALGALLAINKTHTILPGNHLPAVFAHVHLAAVGWAALMVIGVGYRLLPMLLPARPPLGKRVWASAVLIEAGVLGLVGAFLFRPALAAPSAVVLAAGLAAFFGNVAGMLRNRLPPPKKARRPDFGVLHALQSILYFVLCVPLGLYLVFSEAWHTEWIMVYGVFALVGFLAQVVLGVEMRLLPMFAWHEAWVGGGFEERPASPHEMGWRPLQAAAFAAWTAGVPCLAYGFYAGALGWTAAGAWLLLAGTVLAGVSTVRVLRHAFAR